MKNLHRCFSNSLVFLFLVVLISSLIAFDAEGQIDRTFGKKKKRSRVEQQEVTYVVKIMGAPLGFAHESTAVGPKGISSTFFMNISLSRMGQELSMTMSGEWKDDTDGRLLFGKYTLKASDSPVVTTAEMIDNSVRYTSGAAGFEKTRWVLWEEGALGMAAAGEFVESQLKEGATDFTHRAFEIEDGEFHTVRIKRLDAEPMEIDGKRVVPIVFEQYEDGDEIASATTWLDEDYMPIKTVIVQMGMEIVIERISPEELESLEFEPEFDLLRHSGVPAKGFPADVSVLEDVTLRLEFDTMPPEDRDFDGPNQVVKKRGEGSMELFVSRETVTRMKLTDGERREGLYLMSDHYIQSTDPRIEAIAVEVREETGATGWELARALAVWVNAYITEKNYGSGFASALEVLETQAGDCTEHSMLLVALLRAAGIPARPAVGLVYHKGQYLGHMWTEAYVDHWRTLDALELDTLPIRIRIMAAADERALDARDLVRATNVVGGLRVEALEYGLIDGADSARYPSPTSRAAAPTGRTI